MRANLSKQVAEVLGTDVASPLTTSYAVVGYGGVSAHQVGAVGTLAYRGEATFKASGLMTSVTFKVQAARGDAEVADPASVLWTDVALASAAAPGTAPAVEQAINYQSGKTVALDLFSSAAHRGRTHFRVLAKCAGTSAAGDALRVWTTDKP